MKLTQVAATLPLAILHSTAAKQLLDGRQDTPMIYDFDEVRVNTHHPLRTCG
jgi:hypothetical protein